MYIHVVHTKGREMPAVGKNEDRLRHMLTPLCVQLCDLIGHLEAGVKLLVDLKADLLVSCLYIVRTNMYIHNNHFIVILIDWRSVKTILSV